MMSRELKQLGGHGELPVGALTKQEVAAALCHAGHSAGFWCVPEFEVDGDGAKRRIDVVWAERRPGASNPLWQPVAAFEIEGHGVARESIDKDVDSLQAACGDEEIVCAMILFQVGPDGLPWVRRAAEGCVERVEGPVEERVRALRSSLRIEVILDQKLRGCLGEWSARARKAVCQRHAEVGPRGGLRRDSRAVAVAIDDDTLTVDLADGRRVTVPLVWFPKLLRAEPEQRRNWRLIGEGEGVHWPDIDEDLSVEELLRER